MWKMRRQPKIVMLGVFGMLESNRIIWKVVLLTNNLTDATFSDFTETIIISFQNQTQFVLPT